MLIWVSRYVYWFLGKVLIGMVIQVGTFIRNWRVCIAKHLMQLYQSFVYILKSSNMKLRFGMIIGYKLPSKNIKGLTSASLFYWCNLTMIRFDSMYIVQGPYLWNRILGFSNHQIRITMIGFLMKLQNKSRKPMQSMHQRFKIYIV